MLFCCPALFPCAKAYSVFPHVFEDIQTCTEAFFFIYIFLINTYAKHLILDIFVYMQRYKYKVSIVRYCMKV